MESPREIPGLWLPSGVEVDTSCGNQMQYTRVTEDHFEDSHAWVHSMLSTRTGLSLKVEKSPTRTTFKRNRFFDMLFASTITDMPDYFGDLEPGLQLIFADLIIVRVDGQPLPEEYLYCLLGRLELIMPQLKQELQVAKQTGEEAFAACKVRVDDQLSRRKMAAAFQGMIDIDISSGYER